MSSLKETKIGRSEARFEEDSLDCFIYRSTYKPLLKVLLTNCCVKKCAYCLNNLNSKCPRYRLDLLKLCQGFFSLYKRNKVRGIFLSNAISKSVDSSQEAIYEGALLLRKKFNYSGYIHAKVLPQASLSLIKQMFNYADRLSLNLELPAQKYLSSVSEKILFDDLLMRLRYLAEVNKYRKIRSGITTQFVVGASSESDREILQFTQRLYRNLKLRRVYYSGFEPVRGTNLEMSPAVNPLRIKRLYEADFILRDYRFDYKDFCYDKDGNLILESGVKDAFAQRHRDLFPVSVNKADMFLLLRIPGIGPRRAAGIIRLRGECRINSFEKLASIGIPLKVKQWVCF